MTAMPKSKSLLKLYTPPSKKKVEGQALTRTINIAYSREKKD